jgi:hypothetical protein
MFMFVHGLWIGGEIRIQVAKREPMECWLLLEAAGSLVVRQRISSGRRARLLGMNRLDFL